MDAQALSETAPATPLINVFIGQINGVPAHVCDGRELHTLLQNGDLFANWIKARVEKFGFVENQDFAIALGNSKAKRGGHNRADYHLSLNMAKELSMVENNEQGRIARRYFLDMEKAALAAAGQVALPSHLETLLPSEQQTLSEIAHKKCAGLPDQGKALAELWSRLHNKFRIAKYSQLPRTQLADAIVYVTSMELRFAPGAAPTERYIDLTRNDEVRRIMRGMVRVFWFENSAGHNAWSAMRRIGGGATATSFPESRLPQAMAELQRLEQRAMQFFKTKGAFESAAVKWVFGQGAEMMPEPNLPQVGEQLRLQ